VLQDRSGPYVAVDADRDLGIVTITLRGELNSTARSALSEHLTEHLAEYRAQLAGTQPRQLVIDMAEVDFLDWAAAAVIFTATRLLLPAGVKPVMRSPRRPVRRLLVITGLDQHCELDPGDRSSTRRVIIPLPRKAPHGQPLTPRLRWGGYVAAEQSVIALRRTRSIRHPWGTTIQPRCPGVASAALQLSGHRLDGVAVLRCCGRRPRT
jgi:anti-anti-sigma factor